MNGATLDNIRRYIERTGAKIPTAYELHIPDAKALAALAKNDLYAALGLAYTYGQARAIRMEKATGEKLPRQERDLLDAAGALNYQQRELLLRAARLLAE